MHVCLKAGGDQSAYCVANCGCTAIEFFGEAVKVEFFDPLTLRDFDCKVGHIFGEEDKG